MTNEFDPYREALVMEVDTLWPDEYDAWEPEQKRQIEEQLHGHPDQAAELTYVRTFSGFRRQITVTPADLTRLGA